MTTSKGERTASRLNQWIFYGFVALILMTMCLSLVGYLGLYHQYLDITNAFKVQYLASGIAALVYFFLTQRQQWVVVSLASIFISAIEVLPWYIPQGIAASNPAQTMRVLAFNVLASNSEYEQVISWVKTEKPDIAIFMEASNQWIQELKKLDDTFTYHVSAEKIDIQIYSTLPLENPKLNIHGKNRGYVIADINQGANFSLIASHAYPPVVFGQEGFNFRNEQLKKMGEIVAALKKPVVLAGDLNVPMWSPYYQNNLKNIQLKNTRQGFGILPTYEANNFFKAIPIDHCLVSEEIQVADMRLGPSLGSDHRPIIADLVIPNLVKNQPLFNPEIQPELKPAIKL